MRVTQAFLTIYLIVCLSSCQRSDFVSDKIISPSGKYYLVETVNRSDESKENYAYVIIYLYSSDGQLISKLNTHAGDFNKWAIGWDTKRDTVIMNSSDIGFYAWRLENKEFKEIKLTEDLVNQAQKLKQKKYK